MPVPAPPSGKQGTVEASMAREHAEPKATGPTNEAPPAKAPEADGPRPQEKHVVVKQPRDRAFHEAAVRAHSKGPIVGKGKGSIVHHGKGPLIRPRVVETELESIESLLARLGAEAVADIKDDLTTHFVRGPIRDAMDVVWEHALEHKLVSLPLKTDGTRQGALVCVFRETATKNIGRGPCSKSTQAGQVHGMCLGCHNHGAVKTAMCTKHHQEHFERVLTKAAREMMCYVLKAYDQETGYSDEESVADAKST
jgi:hypothetical protein